MFRLVAIFPLVFFSGCMFFPGKPDYAGPKQLPESIDRYYSPTESFGDVSEELVKEEDTFVVKRLTIGTEYGPTTVDYFAANVPNDILVLVFPVLGGKNLFENYFAEYFVRHGIDTAIVHRNSEFKVPINFYRVEELLRETVIRDRIVLDVFEDVYDKRRFGGFGISRGAINLAMTAGVDKRLRYNVLAMGGEDMAFLLKESDEKGLIKFKRRVMNMYNLSEEEMYSFIEENVKTDPKHLAKYIDARDTLMILALFDQIVPFSSGLRLRKEIGRPDTVFIPTGHFTSVAYTRFLTAVMSENAVFPLPFDYIETESMSFYNRSFNRPQFQFQEIPIRIIQFPFRVIGAVLEWIF